MSGFFQMIAKFSAPAHTLAAATSRQHVIERPAELNGLGVRFAPPVDAS
jgi:hypothetical protein